MKSLPIKTVMLALFLGLAAVMLPGAAKADFLDVSVSFDIFSPPPVAIAPPPLPVYVVPAPPDDGFIWLPGHWLWSDAGYFWVPGTWVQPPQRELLWTPGYWAWNDGTFAWHEGYWGRHIGYYGGVNYGGGYYGHGFNGGQWQDGTFVADRRIVNVTNITNITNVTNINNATNSTASYSGGPGGVSARPTPAEISAGQEQHIARTAEQVKNAEAASTNPQFQASVNKGKPAVAATARPGVFTGEGVVAARQAGAPNPAAEKHNQAVLKNPTLAKGAAVPKPAGEQHNPGKGESPSAMEENKNNPENEGVVKPPRYNRPAQRGVGAHTPAEPVTPHEENLPEAKAPEAKPKAHPPSEHKPAPQAQHHAEPKPEAKAPPKDEEPKDHNGEKDPHGDRE